MQQDRGQVIRQGFQQVWQYVKGMLEMHPRLWCVNRSSMKGGIPRVHPRVARKNGTARTAVNHRIKPKEIEQYINHKQFHEVNTCSREGMFECHPPHECQPSENRESWRDKEFVVFISFLGHSTVVLLFCTLGASIELYQILKESLLCSSSDIYTGIATQ